MEACSSQLVAAHPSSSVIHSDIPIGGGSVFHVRIMGRANYLINSLPRERSELGRGAPDGGNRWSRDGEFRVGQNTSNRFSKLPSGPTFLILLGWYS